MSVPVVPLVQPNEDSRRGSNPLPVPAKPNTAGPVSHATPVPTARPAAGNRSSLGGGKGGEAPGGNKAS